MNKAIFLDRDGVINKEIGDYVYRKEDFEYNPGLFDALRILRDRGYLFVIVTNQGGIEKGRYTAADVEALMTDVVKRFEDEGLTVCEYYFSTHHDSISASLDRKPDSMMIEKGLARFNIDPSISYIIGDATRDMEAGLKVGLNTIKIDSNQNLLDIVDEIVEH